MPLSPSNLTKSGAMSVECPHCASAAGARLRVPLDNAFADINFFACLSLALAFNAPRMAWRAHRRLRRQIGTAEESAPIVSHNFDRLDAIEVLSSPCGHVFTLWAPKHREHRSQLLPVRDQVSPKRMHV